MSLCARAFFSSSIMVQFSINKEIFIVDLQLIFVPQYSNNNPNHGFHQENYFC